MNIIKGSFYVFYQSYKKQNLIFWMILLSIVLFTFFLSLTVVKDNQFGLTVSIPLYVFFAIRGAKWLTSTFPYFVRTGMSRMQYLAMTGLFFVGWSLVTSLFSACLHQTIIFVKEFMIMKNKMLIHPTYLFDPELAFHNVLLLDFVILLFCLVSGLLMNFIFFRFGLVGGYSFIGGLVIIPLLAIALKWYEPLFQVVGDLPFLSLCGVIALISLALYGVIAFSLKRLSAIPV